MLFPFQNSNGHVRNDSTVKIATSATNPPSSRLKVPQLSIGTSRSTSLLTEDDQTNSFIFSISFLNVKWDILKWINVEKAKFRANCERQDGPELRDLDQTELKVFLGFLYYSTVLKSNHECSRYIFATAIESCEIFKCNMSEKIFGFLQYLHFDNQLDRLERKE